MQIVIDISENIYNLIARGEEGRDFVYKSDLMRAILEGIPLPKGHGDLKDVLDKIKADIKKVYNDRPYSYNHSQRTELFCEVMKIIDKYNVESEDKE